MRSLLLMMALFFAFGVGANEPDIRSVQQVALHFAGYDSEEISKWSGRARWAAALPRLQVGFDRDARRTVSLDTKDSVAVTGGNVLVGPAENNFNDNFRTDNGVEVRAVWYLNELIFNRDSLDVSAEQRRWHQERMRLLDDVSRTYYERQELWVKLKGHALPPGERPRLERLFQERTARLDALTGGWYAQEAPQP